MSKPTAAEIKRAEQMARQAFWYGRWRRKYDILKKLGRNKKEPVHARIAARETRDMADDNIMKLKKRIKEQYE